MPRDVGEPLLGEELERGAPAGPPVHHLAAVQQNERLERVVHRRRGLVDGHHERAPALAPEGVEARHRLARHRAVQPARGLVEEHAPRGAQQRARHRGALHLPARDAADEAVAHVRVRAPPEVELANHLLRRDALAVARLPPAAGERRLGREEDRLANRRAADEPVLLLDVRGVLHDRGLGGRAAVEVHRAEDLALGLALGEDVEERRLPGAARAHHRAHVARTDHARDLRTRGTTREARG